MQQTEAHGVISPTHLGINLAHYTSDPHGFASCSNKTKRLIHLQSSVHCSHSRFCICCFFRSKWSCFRFNRLINSVAGSHGPSEDALILFKLVSMLYKCWERGEFQNMQIYTKCCTLVADKADSARMAMSPNTLQTAPHRWLCTVHWQAQCVNECDSDKFHVIQLTVSNLMICGVKFHCI